MAAPGNSMLFFFGALIVVCAGYLYWFSTALKKKTQTQIKEVVLTDKQRILWVRDHFIPLLKNIRSWFVYQLIPNLAKAVKDAWMRDTPLTYLCEILLITIWAIFVGRAYLNMDPMIWPTGSEFSSGIQTHYIWNNFKECGACVFWNGFVRGGAPAFADMHGSMLYPFVILLTLMNGVLNGAKLVLIASLIMTGFAQWWIAKVMGLGRIPRFWSGILAVVGAHLAGRMELGVFGVVLSVAACSLVIAPGIALGLTGKRRYSILMGIMIGLALLSGQGYMQVGLVLGILPAFFIFLPESNGSINKVWKEYLLAGFLGFLIAGIFLIPMLHFYPSTYKTEDPLFGAAQSFRFIPLNLVINDLDFYNTEILKPTSYPHLYVTFMGWIPVLLAIIGWRFIPKGKIRLLVYFLTATLLIYLTASADLLKLIQKILPIAAGVRNSPQISALANPLILGVSAWGLDLLLKKNWPKFALVSSEFQPAKFILGISPVIILLAFPLFWSVKEAYDFGQTWLQTFHMDESLYQKVDALKTGYAEWVNVPFGEHYWMIPALDNNLKVGDGIRTWSWKERDNPTPYLEASQDEPQPGAANLIQTIDNLYYYTHAENEYAYIEADGQRFTCFAQATGGNIDVTCPDVTAGKLVVMENNWTGWSAWMDDTRIPLKYANWLTVDSLNGRHTYHFRYRPWDVWVGIFLTALGIYLSIVLWQRDKKINQPPSPPSIA
jgi:hypothetical protein